MSRPSSASLKASISQVSEAEHRLWRFLRENDDATAREALFNMYQPTARRLAWRFLRDRTGLAMELAELQQIANLALLESIDRYDPAREVPFRFYCSRRISGAIIDGIACSSEVSQLIATRHTIKRERLRSLKQDRAVAVTLDERLNLLSDIAAELAIGLMIEDTAMVLNEDRDPAPNGYETLAWKQASQRLLQAIDGLPQREAMVIRQHYVEGIPFDHIARIAGLSKGRISQLHKAALEFLRKRLSATDGFQLRS